MLGPHRRARVSVHLLRPAAQEPSSLVDRSTGLWLTGEKQGLDTFRALGRAFPDSLWSISFLEAGAGSWVCAADVLEHEKEPQ